ncbi:hypothetical protein V8E55_008229 [Tylopilus felleus]|jgi:hypothetical protein
MSYPPVAFPPPPTSNTRSSQERAALVRSSKKLSKVLGEVPRVLDDDVPPVPELTHTLTGGESTWRKRKPTHLPPLLKLSPSPSPINSPTPLTTHHRGSVLSLAPSIVSNAPSTVSGSSVSDVPSESSWQRIKLERLRRKLGDDLPATAVWSTTPHTAVPRTPKTSTSTYTPMPKRSPRGRTRSIARLPTATRPDDARSITFSINSDESIHTVAFSAVRVHSPHPPKTRQKHVYQTGALPPVPPIPTHLASSATSRCDDDDTGLVRPRQKVAAGSKIGGSDFKAARRAKREGRLAEPGELIEMVGFGW